MSGEHFVIPHLAYLDAAGRTEARIARNERNSSSCNEGSPGRERERREKGGGKGEKSERSFFFARLPRVWLAARGALDSRMERG